MAEARLTTEAADVLGRATVDGMRVRLPAEQLPRDLYEEVNAALVRLGGKWKSGGKYPDGTPKGTHIFPYDPAPLLAAVVETGEMPPKNPTAFFPTPAPIVAQMIEWADLEWLNEPGRRILEPSAGTGAIADAIRAVAPLAQLDIVEALGINASMLRAKGYDPHEGDFLKWYPGHEVQYDAILMNPPFSLDGDPLAYISHINYAWAWLKPGGLLVAIAPPSFLHRTDARSREFLQDVAAQGEWDEIPAGAFKESGTMVATMMLRIQNDDQQWKRNPHQGFGSWEVWATCLWASCERQFHDARNAIFARIRSGTLGLDLFGNPEPDTLKVIRDHYDAVVLHAHRQGTGVRLQDSDTAELIEHFMGEYRQWCDWQDDEQRPAPANDRAA